MISAYEHCGPGQGFLFVKAHKAEKEGYTPLVLRGRALELWEVEVSDNACLIY